MCKDILTVILLFLIWFIANCCYGDFRGIVMTEITKQLLTDEMIPIAPMNGEDLEKMKITIDGYNAECFIAQRMGSDKIIILFEKSHPKYGNEFMTKYFEFKEPGKMNWGHSTEFMHIKIA